MDERKGKSKTKDGKSAERTGSESNPNSEDVSQKHKSDESDVPETIPGEEEQGGGRTGYVRRPLGNIQHSS